GRAARARHTDALAFAQAVLPEVVARAEPLPRPAHRPARDVLGDAGGRASVRGARGAGSERTSVVAQQVALLSGGAARAVPSGRARRALALVRADAHVLPFASRIADPRLGAAVPA